MLDTSLTMAYSQSAQKRKRHGDVAEDIDRLQTRIGGKIHHEKKEVRKASKKAKTFETQKVVKRLKDLRTKGEETSVINRFEEELVSLKVVNHDAIGDSAFMSRIQKDSVLRHHESVIAIAKAEFESKALISSEPGTTAARIHNRLLSSKILSAQVAASINSLKILVDPSAKRRKVEHPTVESEALPSKNTKNIATPPRPTLLEKNDQEPELVADDVSWSSGTIDEENDDDSGGELGRDPFPDSQRYATDDSESNEWNEQDDESNDVPLDKNNHQKTPNVKVKSSSISQSTFLPSLSVGFVKGPDDSDFDEVDGGIADMPKKNRRGQRARRLIWERKYGRNANHKKKEAQERAAFLAKKMLKDKKSTIKKPHPASGANVTKVIPHRWPSTSQRADSYSPSHDNKWSSGAKTDKPLHPSWEAKRKLKDKDRASIVPSQGKKIKF